MGAVRVWQWKRDKSQAASCIKHQKVTKCEAWESAKVALSQAKAAGAKRGKVAGREVMQ